MMIMSLEDGFSQVASMQSNTLKIIICFIFVLVPVAL